MDRKVIFWIILLIFILAIVCMEIYISSLKENNKENSKIANPASVFCKEQGGTLEIKVASDGSQTGYCTKGSKECEEWGFYRGECIL
jgi:putative hemolysin